MRLSALACMVALLAATSPSALPRRRAPIDKLPRLIVWAWERPEDLRDLAPGIGVAFLAQTITIAGSGFHVQPRRQPLRVEPTTPLMAVTRIQVSGAIDPFDRTTIVALASAIAAPATRPRVAAIQVDFDATASERPFYREFLRAIRAKLPVTVPLSITALASWCTGDDWLDALAIDEAVPMLFRMGPANEPYRHIAQGSASAAASCRGAVGMSLDEPTDVRSDQRRVYVFNPRPWTRLTLLQARSRTAR